MELIGGEGARNGEERHVPGEDVPGGDVPGEHEPGEDVPGEHEPGDDEAVGSDLRSDLTWGPRPNPLFRIAAIGTLAAGVGASVDEFGRTLAAPFTPLTAWWQRQPGLRRVVPLCAAVVLGSWYFWVFSVLVWNRHERFGTFDYDLGMYDHGIWQTSHFRNFMTTRGMHLFGHHANVGFLLFVPFYWVGLGGPHLLNIANTAGVVATAVPIYLLARRHLRSDWAGFWLVAIYLFHFSTQWKIQETFHAESLAAPFVVWAFYLASVGRWRWYWFCIVAAMMWKEDLALATAMIGIAVGFIFGQWRIAARTVAVSAFWFLFATKVIMAGFAPEAAVFDSLFGPLGADTNEVVVTSLQHPSRLWTTIDCHGAWSGELKVLEAPVEGVWCPGPEALTELNPPPRGFATLMGPLGYLGFLSPVLLLVGLPQHIVNSATVANFTWDLRWHYALMPFIGVLLASVWATVRRKRAVAAWAMIAVMAVGVVATHERGIGPWTTASKSGYWPLYAEPADELYREAMRGIDDGDVVSTNYFFVPHLSHRKEIYTFPNPWKSSNFGAGGTDIELPDPGTVDVLLIDAKRLGEADLALFDEVLASGEFDVAFHEQIDVNGRLTEVYRLERPDA
ncbi:MAG: DUF2079 domain-containing protein [Actinobacteria bacterium]|nr:DUF2079 domain-containing protein [Actinomycetota bacterium]